AASRPGARTLYRLFSRLHLLGITSRAYPQHQETSEQRSRCSDHRPVPQFGFRAGGGVSGGGPIIDGGDAISVTIGALAAVAHAPRSESESRYSQPPPTQR